MDLNQTWPNVGDLPDMPGGDITEYPLLYLLRTNSETDLQGLAKRRRRKSDGFMEWRAPKDVAQEMREHIARLKSELEQSRLALDNAHRENVAQIKKIRDEEETKLKLACLEIEYKLTAEKDKELSEQYDNLVEDLHKQLSELAQEKDEVYNKAQEFWEQEKNVLLQNLYGEIRSEARQEYGDEYERIRRKYEVQMFTLSTDNQQLESELKLLKDSDRRRLEELRRITEDHRQELEKIKKESKLEIKSQLVEIKQLNGIIAQLEEQLGIGVGTCLRLQMEKESLDDALCRLKKADSWDRRTSTSKPMPAIGLGNFGPTWSPPMNGSRSYEDKDKILQRKNLELSSLVRRLDEKNQQLAAANLELLEELDTSSKSVIPFKEKAKRLGAKNMELNHRMRRLEEKCKSQTQELSKFKEKVLSLQDQSYKKEKQLAKLREKTKPGKDINDNQRQELERLRNQTQHHLQIIAELQHENADKERRIELLKARKRFSKIKSKSLQALDDLDDGTMDAGSFSWDAESELAMSPTFVGDTFEDEERVKRLIVERIHLEKAYMKLQDQVGGTSDPERAEKDFSTLQADLVAYQSQIDDLQNQLLQAKTTFDEKRSLMEKQNAEVQQDLQKKLINAESDLIAKDLSIQKLQEELKDVEDQKELLEFRIVEMDQFYHPKPSLKQPGIPGGGLDGLDENCSGMSVRLALKEIELSRFDELNADERTALLKARKLIENGDKMMSLVDSSEALHREAMTVLETRYKTSRAELSEKNSEISALKQKLLRLEEKSLFTSSTGRSTGKDDQENKKQQELARQAELKIADLERTNESLTQRIKRLEEGKKSELSGEELSLLTTKVEQLNEAEKKINALESSNLELLKKLQNEEEKKPTWYDSVSTPELITTEIAEELGLLKQENISLKNDLNLLRSTSEEAFNVVQEAKAELSIRTTASQTEADLEMRIRHHSSQGAQTDSSGLDPSYLISRLGSHDNNDGEDNGGDDDVFAKQGPRDIEEPLTFENLLKSCSPINAQSSKPLGTSSNAFVYNTTAVMDSQAIKETLTAILAGLPMALEKSRLNDEKLDPSLAIATRAYEVHSNKATFIPLGSTDDQERRQKEQGCDQSETEQQRITNETAGKISSRRCSSDADQKTIQSVALSARGASADYKDAMTQRRSDSGYTTERDERTDGAAAISRVLGRLSAVNNRNESPKSADTTMTVDSEVEHLLAFGDALKRSHDSDRTLTPSPPPRRAVPQSSLEIAMDSFLQNDCAQLGDISPTPLTALRPLPDVQPDEPTMTDKHHARDRAADLDADLRILSSSLNGRIEGLGSSLPLERPQAPPSAVTKSKWHSSDFSSLYESLPDEKDIDTPPTLRRLSPARLNHFRSRSAESSVTSRLPRVTPIQPTLKRDPTASQWQCQGRLYNGSVAYVESKSNANRTKPLPSNRLDVSSSSESPLTSSTPQESDSADNSVPDLHLIARRKSFPMVSKSHFHGNANQDLWGEADNGRRRVRSRSCDIECRHEAIPKDVKILKQHCESLERQLKNKDVIMRSMKAELKEELESIALLEKKEKEIQERTERCHFLSQELKIRERELEGKVCEITKRDTLIRQLRCDIKKLEEEKRTIEHTYHEVQTHVSRMESTDRRLVHLQDQYDGACQKNTELRERIRILECTEREYYELERSVCELQEQLRDMESVESHRDELYQKLVIIKKQRDEFLEKGKLVECERNDFLRCSKTMEQNVEEYRCRIESLKTSNTTLQQKVIMLEREKHDLETTITSCHQETNTLRSRITKIECERDSVIRDLREMTSEKKCLEQRLTELEGMLGDHDKLEEGFHSLRIKLAELTRQRDDAELFIPTLKAKISLLKKACREKEEEITRLREQCRPTDCRPDQGKIPDSWLRSGQSEDTKMRETSYFHKGSSSSTQQQTTTHRRRRSSSEDSVDSYDGHKHSKSHRHRSKHGHSRDRRSKRYRALFDYDPYATGTSDHPERELKLKEGDYLTVYGEVDIDGFLEAEIDGLTGLVPSIYVEEMHGEHSHSHSHAHSSSTHQHSHSNTHQHGHSQTRHDYIVLYDYDPYTSCTTSRPDLQLTLRKNDIITVIGGVDVDGYYTAEFNGRTGLVPSNFMRRLSVSESHKHSQCGSETVGFKGQIELEEDNVVGPPFSPKELKLVRVLSKDAVLLGWTPPPMNELGRSNGALVTGYRLWYNGSPKQEIDSPSITKAIMEGINLEGRVEFSIQTVAENGFCSEKCHFAITGALSLLTQSDDEYYACGDVSSRAFVALYDYDPFKSSPNPNPALELCFKEGDLVKVLDMSRSDGFFQAEIRGKCGLVPSNFIEEISVSGTRYGQSHRHQSSNRYSSYSKQFSSGKRREARRVQFASQKLK